MQKKAGLSRGTALGLAALLLVCGVVLGFMAWQCLTTDMYKLYNAPYQGCTSRYEYYEQQAAQKLQEAESYTALGQEALALNASLTA